MQLKTLKPDSIVAGTVARQMPGLAQATGEAHTHGRGMAASMLGLQHTHGNRFVQRMLTGALVQRKCTCGGACDSCQSHEAPHAPEVSSGILQRKSSGQPLDSQVRDFMENRFGEDFGAVRVHTDTYAAQSARRMNAIAYTTGHDIFFEGNQYLPQTQAGKQLLAHELTHVVQQRAPFSSLSTKAATVAPVDALEREANEVADKLSSPESLTVRRRAQAGSPQLQQPGRPGQVSTDPVCRVLQREQQVGTQQMILENNAITGNPPGRNVMVRRSDGTMFDLTWTLDVAWVTAELGGDCSSILGTVFGRIGEVFCAGVGVVSGALSYVFARIVGAAVTAYTQGVSAGWRYLTSGTINFENVNGADVGLSLGATGAVAGAATQLRDFVHGSVRSRCGVP
jgi:hypothetical protein